MANPLTLSPDTLADLVQNLAKQRNTSPEAMLEELAYRYLDTIPVELLEDEQVLVLADMMMPSEEAEKLNDLLEQQTESRLDEAGKRDLDALMQIHNQMLLRKSEAIAVAVQRSLRSPLIS